MKNKIMRAKAKKKQKKIKKLIKREILAINKRINQKIPMIKTRAIHLNCQRTISNLKNLLQMNKNQNNKKKNKKNLQRKLKNPLKSHYQSLLKNQSKMMIQLTKMMRHQMVITRPKIKIPPQRT